MSYYYYEDTSHYCYTVPTHHEDTSIPYDPHIYGNSSSDPVYYDESPSEPVYYNDIAPDVVHYVETPSYDELEAYAEATLNRTYTVDEIHPAYRDNSFGEAYTESSNFFEPPNIEIHPTYLSHPPPVHSHDGDSPPQLYPHVNPPVGRRCAHEQGYYWTTYASTNSTRFDPPSDPTFYDTASHDQSLSEDLRYTAERIEAVLEEWREWDHWDRIDGLQDLIEERKPRQDQLVHLAQHIDGILQQRAELDSVDEALEDPDGNNILQFQSTSPTQSVFDNITPTLPPDIGIPDPLPLSPNIWSKPTHFKSTFLITASQRREPRYYFAPLCRRRQPNFRNKTRTRPPDIRPPKPHPISPNIRTQRPHFRSPVNQHPPFIRPPKPIPPKPNILVRQPQRPLYIRPQRKHPPVRYPISPTPQNRHHCAIRRILKKSRPHLS